MAEILGTELIDEQNDFTASMVSLTGVLFCKIDE